MNNTLLFLDSPFQILTENHSFSINMTVVKWPWIHWKPSITGSSDFWHIICINYDLLTWIKDATGCILSRLAIAIIVIQTVYVIINHIRQE